MKNVDIYHYHGRISELDGTDLEDRKRMEGLEKSDIYDLVDSALERKLTVQIKRFDDDYRIMITTFGNFSAR